MNKCINENFFYIDSLNISNTVSKLYGFSVSEKNNKISLTSGDNEIAGSYISVKNINNEIFIDTDDFSSLYVFYYMSNEFFAISNSFYLLLENLKQLNKNLSINKNYVQQFLQSPLHSHSMYETMINEIKILPFGKNIEIKNNIVSIVDKNIVLHSINLFSQQGLTILNNWINKWTNILKAILNSEYNVTIDLSGGYDSRVIFALAYYTHINLNNDNILIYSKEGDNIGMKQHLMDDYDIAKKITNTLNITINKPFINSNSKPNYYSSDEQYELLKYAFLGLHKSGFNCVAKYNYPRFHFGGLNGEVIRGALPKLNYNTIKNRLSKNPIRNEEIVVTKFFDDLKQLNENDYDSLTEFFLTTQCRSHFGLSIFNSYIANIYNINPFNDKDLLTLYIPDEYDKDIIFSLIIYITCPQIFNIPFTNNSNFSEKTKSKTIELFNSYDFKFIDKHYVLNDLKDLYKEKQNNYDKKYGYDKAYEIFINNKEFFIEQFGKLFDNDYANKLYDYANKFYLNKENFSRNTWVNCLTSIIEVMKILNN